MTWLDHEGHIHSRPSRHPRGRWGVEVHHFL